MSDDLREARARLTAANDHLIELEAAEDVSQEDILHALANTNRALAAVIRHLEAEGRALD